MFLFQANMHTLWLTDINYDCLVLLPYVYPKEATNMNGKWVTILYGCATLFAHSYTDSLPQSIAQSITQSPNQSINHKITDSLSHSFSNNYTLQYDAIRGDLSKVDFR